MSSSGQIAQARRSVFQAGFTLVEIMVGLTIGMLATLVVMQMFSVFETQKRSTTGTADAQTNGSIALYRISQEAQQSGFALIPTNATVAGTSPIACTQLKDGGAVTSVNRLFPVVITDGGAGGGSDAITIRYGDSPTGGASAKIIDIDAASQVLSVRTSLGCSKGDKALVSALYSGNCAMSVVTDVQSAVVPQTVRVTDVSDAVKDGFLACLGAWHEITYQVNAAGFLERQDLAVSNTFDPVAPDIVNLQAQYGITSVGASLSNKIDQWVDASGATWGAPSVADRNRIKAVRIAVVARNPKMETSDVSASCGALTGVPVCSWTGSASSPAPAVDLNTANTQWKRYRYRVYETILPLRNMVWSKDNLG